MNQVQQAAAAIEATVRDYLDGMVFADAARLRQAFHPKASIVGHINGKLAWMTLNAFVSNCEKAGGAPANEPYYWEILSADVTGDVALIKVADDYMGIRFTDYLTLLRQDDGWVIVNKTFRAQG
jgi:hypothetical protein